MQTVGSYLRGKAQYTQGQADSGFILGRYGPVHSGASRQWVHTWEVRPNTLRGKQTVGSYLGGKAQYTQGHADSGFILGRYGPVRTLF